MFLVQQKYFWLLSVFCLLSACASSGKIQPQIQQQVQFDGKNTQAVVLSPFYLPDPQEQRADLAWALTLRVSDGKPFFGLLKPNQLLVDPLVAFFTSLNLQPGQPLNGEKSSEVAGCQGENRIRVNFGPSGEFSGSLSYQDFSDNCSLSLTTTLPFQGKLDTGTGQLTLKLDYHDLNARMGERHSLLQGQLQLAMNVFPGGQKNYTALVDMLLNESDGQQYRLEKMLFSWNLAGPYPQFSLAGTIHFSQYGAVQVTTDSPLISHTLNGPPFDGMLTFKGAADAWRRLYFAKSSYPGSFRIDGSNGMKSMGKF